VIPAEEVNSAPQVEHLISGLSALLFVGVVLVVAQPNNARDEPNSANASSRFIFLFSFQAVLSRYSNCSI
jgi:hypothetical protein